MELKRISFYIEAMIEVEEDHVEINSGCPTSLGGSKSSDPGWAGCKERDGGHHMP